MTTVEAALRRAIADLTAAGHDHAVIGGIAVSVRTEPRFTRDVDIAVAVADDTAAEAAVRALVEAGWQVQTVLEHDVSGRLATVRLQPRGQTPAGVVVDLLFASSGIEPEVVTAAEPLEVFPGLEIRVATTAHLLALKLLANADERPQDAADLQALIDVATAADAAAAREAVTLIEARGYHRGRDLPSDLDALLARERPTARLNEDAD